MLWRLIFERYLPLLFDLLLVLLIGINRNNLLYCAAREYFSAMLLHKIGGRLCE